MMWADRLVFFLYSAAMTFLVWTSVTSGSGLTWESTTPVPALFSPNWWDIFGDALVKAGVKDIGYHAGSFGLFVYYPNNPDRWAFLLDISWRIALAYALPLWLVLRVLDWAIIRPWCRSSKTQG
jgi:hypothetical protein